VAGFIGSPAMNLLRGALLHTDDGVEMRLGSSPPALGDALPSGRRHAGEAVVVGIRPEALDGAPAGDGPALELPVVLVEALASDKLVNLQSDAPRS
jgi:multiple sugar transport system ATP-binding protein